MPVFVMRHSWVMVFIHSEINVKFIIRAMLQEIDKTVHLHRFNRRLNMRFFLHLDIQFLSDAQNLI